MDRDTLKKSGLLEQYALGLTNRRENEIVEAALANSEEVREDLSKLRKQFDSYAETQGTAAPNDGRPQRPQEEFEDLDHEMILALIDRNYTLSIWRYVLGGLVLLLIGLTGFLFRQNQQATSDLINEKALHAQDDQSYAQQLRKVQEETARWSAIGVKTVTTPHGPILVHQSPARGVAFIDLSHTQTLEDAMAYFVNVFRAEEMVEETVHAITATAQLRLHPVASLQEADTLRIYLGAIADTVLVKRDTMLVAEVAVQEKE